MFRYQNALCAPAQRVPHHAQQYVLVQKPASAAKLCSIQLLHLLHRALDDQLALQLSVNSSHSDNIYQHSRQPATWLRKLLLAAQKRSTGSPRHKTTDTLPLNSVPG